MPPGVPGSGCSVPGYDDLRELARGGMGVVYRAFDPALGRVVAIKTLLPDAAFSDTRRRFEREARITARLQHPAIPPVHGCGELTDGRPFLAMKLVEGRTLSALLRDRPDPSADLARFVQIFESICQAVAFAHSKGVVHRDLKPSNVMVGAFGEVQVMDWGLARGRDEGGGTRDEGETAGPGPVSSLTLAGSGLGTPAYMPPEQANGEWDKAGPHSDVFALGGILCTILTGKPTYTGGNEFEKAKAADVADAHRRLAACGADAALVALAWECLSPDPADRPADAGLVAKAVAAYRAGVEERLRAAETELVRAGERRKRLRVWAAAAGLVLTGGVAFAWWADHQAGRKRAEAGERAARNAEALDGLVSRCEAALRADNAILAATVMTEIDARLTDAGGDDLAPRIARCRADLELLRELDRIDDLKWTAGEEGLPPAGVIVSEFPAPFARYGLVPGVTPPEEAARRINESLIRDRLLGALELWSLLGQPEGVSAFLRAADADPYHTELRTALANDDGRPAADLLAQPGALDQPTWFAVALAGNARLPQPRRAEVLRAAHARTPGSFPLLMALGSLPMTGPGDPADRIRWFTAALAVRPENVAVWNDLGFIHYRRGEWDEAIHCFRRAIELRPGLSDKHNNLGLALRAKGDLAGAIAAYREAIRLNPDNPRPHNNLGYALSLRGESDEAIREYEEAIRLDPKYAAPRFNLGNAYYARSEERKALAEYREAVRLDPNDSRFYHNLGVVLFRIDDFAAAEAAYREAIRLNPAYVSAHVNLGAVLLARDDPDGAMGCFLEALSRDPKHPRARAGIETAQKLKANRIAPPPREVMR